MFPSACFWVRIAFLRASPPWVRSCCNCDSIPDARVLRLVSLTISSTFVLNTWSLLRASFSLPSAWSLNNCFSTRTLKFQSRLWLLNDERLLLRFMLWFFIFSNDLMDFWLLVFDCYWKSALLTRLVSVGCTLCECCPDSIKLRFKVPSCFVGCLKLTEKTFRDLSTPAVSGMNILSGPSPWSLNDCINRLRALVLPLCLVLKSLLSVMPS